MKSFFFFFKKNSKNWKKKKIYFNANAKVFIEINFFVDKTFVIDCTADDNIFKDKKKKKIPSIVPFLLYRCAQTCYGFLQPRGTMFPWFFHPGTMTRLAQLSAKALFLVIVGDGNVRLGWKKLSTVIVFYLTLGGLFHFRSFRN